MEEYHYYWIYLLVLGLVLYGLYIAMNNLHHFWRVSDYQAELNNLQHSINKLNKLKIIELEERIERLEKEKKIT